MQVFGQKGDEYRPVAAVAGKLLGQILRHIPGHVSREDGCKVYFQDGSWVICRFSGTEPLLRMAAEGGSMEEAEDTPSHPGRRKTAPD